MGIFWLFAEGLIMIYVRKGLLFLENGQSRQRIFLITCCAIFILLTMLNYGYELGLLRLFHITSRPLQSYYYSFVWNLFCTLWIVIEGAIAFYVFRIYNLLRGRVDGKKPIFHKIFLNYV